MVVAINRTTRTAWMESLSERWGRLMGVGLIGWLGETGGAWSASRPDPEM